MSTLELPADKYKGDKTPEELQAIGQGVVEAAAMANTTSITLTKHINDNCNIPPMTALAVSMGVVVFICLAYYMVKPAPLTGEWYDSSGVQYYFKQRGKKVSVLSGGHKQEASFIENVFKLGDNIGVYDHAGVIRSNSGVSFYKV